MSAGRQRVPLVELDSRYADVICRRRRDRGGGPAVLDGDGRCFEELAAGREAA